MYNKFLLIKHGQVRGNLFELLYGEPVPAHALTRNMQSMILALMEYDNQLERDHVKKAEQSGGGKAKDQKYIIQTTSLEEIKFRIENPELVNLPVTLLTTKEWEELGEPTDHN